MFTNAPLLTTSPNARRKTQIKQPIRLYLPFISEDVRTLCNIPLSEISMR